MTKHLVCDDILIKYHADIAFNKMKESCNKQINTHDVLNNVNSFNPTTASGSFYCSSLFIADKFR